MVFGVLIERRLMLKHFNRALDGLEIGDKPEEKLVNVRSFMSAGRPLTWGSQGFWIQQKLKWRQGMRCEVLRAGVQDLCEHGDRSLPLVSSSRVNLRKGQIDDEIWQVEASST